MCGIVGVLSQKERVDKHLIVQMANELRHRGPDDEGYYYDKTQRLGLGFRRLSIIDLHTGNQPISNESKTIQLIFNGEIYNYQQLRVDLQEKGHIFSTNGDTECVVHGYEEYGEDVFKLLNGMFAVAIWDEKNKKLLLARDRCGEKPLFYFLKEDLFIFASELKSILLHPAVEKNIDWDGFAEYFSFGYISAPHSIYEGIRKVLPGHVLIVSDHKAVEKSYWDIDLRNEFPGDYEEGREECLRLFEDAVKMRMYSDVPLGGFLSGGIDSSAVVAMMSKSSKSINSFSIGFDEKEFDERQYAREVAQKYQTLHRELIVTLKVQDVFEKILANFDEPFGDPSAIPTFLLANLTREYVTVALSGDGGDELFGGYDTYPYMLRQIKKTDRFPQLSKRMAKLFSHLLPAKSYLGKRLWILANREPERFIDLVTPFKMTDKKALFNENIYKKINGRLSGSLAKKLIYFDGKGDFVKQMLYSDFKHYLANDILVKVDRTTMLASLESRAPFLDHRLVELVFSFPSQWKVGPKNTKIILRDMLRESLPANVLARKKMGFGIPLKKWFTDALIDVYHHRLLSPETDLFFNRKTVLRYLEEHKHKNIDRTYEIWLILVFLLWAQGNLKMS